MRLLPLIIVLLLPSTRLFSQSVLLPLTFSNRTPTGVSTRVQSIGIHPSATIGYDESLGEVEIPPFPLPGGIFYVWSVLPTSETVWLSPLDLRPFRNNQRWIDTFNLRASWSGGMLEVSWPSSKPEYIDSVYLVDGFTDFPNNVVKAKLWTSDVFTTSNPAIDRFRCIVWWNTTGTSIQQPVWDEQSEEVYPQPARNLLTFRSKAKSYQLIDLMGRVLIQGALQERMAFLNVEHLPSGTYVVMFTTSDGTVGRTIVIE